jgi:hypothetical protein
VVTVAAPVVAMEGAAVAVATDPGLDFAIPEDGA